MRLVLVVHPSKKTICILNLDVLFGRGEQAPKIHKVDGVRGTATLLWGIGSFAQKLFQIRTSIFLFFYFNISQRQHTYLTVVNI